MCPQLSVGLVCDDFLHVGQVSPPTGGATCWKPRGEMNASCMLYKTYCSSFSMCWVTIYYASLYRYKLLRGQCKCGLVMSCGRLKMSKERDNPKLQSLKARPSVLVNFSFISYRYSQSCKNFAGKSSS